MLLLRPTRLLIFELFFGKQEKKLVKFHNTGGPRISRFFGGKKIPHYAKPRYAGTIYSTSLVLKTAKRGKLFFKVHFLSIFSYLELCIAHQIDAIFNANSNLVSN